jgi:hypothetical protein
MIVSVIIVIASSDATLRVTLYFTTTLEWLLSELCVALECVCRAGKVFVVLPRRWLVARSFAWILGCVGCRAVMMGCVRWLVRRMAKEKKC